MQDIKLNCTNAWFSNVDAFVTLATKLWSASKSKALNERIVELKIFFLHFYYIFTNNEQFCVLMSLDFAHFYMIA